MSRRVVTHAAFLAEGERRFGPDARNWKFICPACKSVQGADDFYAAGFERGTGKVNNVLGYSCIGRFTGKGPAGSTRTQPGKGCDWTLGGLLQIHELEVQTAESRVPHMEFADIPMALSPAGDIGHGQEVRS